MDKMSDHEPVKHVVGPGEVHLRLTKEVSDKLKETPVKTVFVNRMPANDNDDTVAYGVGDRVMHQVQRSETGEYPDQMSIEVEDDTEVVHPEPVQAEAAPQDNVGDNE